MGKHRSLALEYEIMLQELLSAAGNPPQMVRPSTLSPPRPLSSPLNLTHRPALTPPSSRSTITSATFLSLIPTIPSCIQDPDGYPNRRRLVSVCILIRELLRNRAFGPLHSLACCLLSDLFSSIFLGCSISKEMLEGLAPPADESLGLGGDGETGPRGESLHEHLFSGSIS
jgi:hypothetical protein